MKDKNLGQIPVHLQQLLLPTPSGTAKLMSAWSGLSPETQVLVLTEKKRRPGPAYLYDQFLGKAFESGNAYVRYLVARECHFGDDDGEREKALMQQLEEDPDPLVRYANLESTWSAFGSELRDPDKFFALAHEARLAKVRMLTSGGERVAELISHAADHQLKDGTVSEIELFEILSDYLNKPEFKGAYERDHLRYDGFAELPRWQRYQCSLGARSEGSRSNLACADRTSAGELWTK